MIEAYTEIVVAVFQKMKHGKGGKGKTVQHHISSILLLQFVGLHFSKILCAVKL